MTWHAAAMQTDALYAASCVLTSWHQCRSWQARIEKLAKDRNAEIRQVASLVLQALVMPLDFGIAYSPASSAKSSPARRISAAKVASPGQQQLASAGYASRSQGSLRQPSVAERFQEIAVSREESNESEIESCQAFAPAAVQRRMDGMQSGPQNPNSPLHDASSSSALGSIGPERQAVTAASRAAAANSLKGSLTSSAAASLSEAPNQPREQVHFEANGTGTRSFARIPSIGQEPEGRDRIAEKPHAIQNPQVQSQSGHLRENPPCVCLRAVLPLPSI